MRHNGILLKMAFFSAVLPFWACSEQEETVEPVDLRYEVNDSYQLDAVSPEQISFQVKSTSSWEVYSYHPDWCTIEPASGDADEVYTVNVVYRDNGELDDRVDTLVIKSSYWIGKWVTVNQKGSAYLNVDAADLELAVEGGQATFNIRSNQDWSVSVTAGAEWLSVLSGSEGRLDGPVTVKASENTGERRYATVTVYDRHGVETTTVNVVQDGVQLDPDTFELRAYYDDAKIELPVISNTKWTVSKDDEKDEWYSFESESFEGNGTLVVILQENQTSSLKVATFTLTTEGGAGVEPVTRQITLKQAYNSLPERHYFKDGLGIWSLDSGSYSLSDKGVTFSGAGRISATMQTGTFTFHIHHESDDARSIIYYTFSAQELRWHMNAGTKMTEASTTPWSALNNVSFDPAVANDATMVMSDDGTGYIKAEWLLNGDKFTELPTTSGKWNNATWLSYTDIIIGSTAGTVTFEWYEYTRPISWE